MSLSEVASSRQHEGNCRATSKVCVLMRPGLLVPLGVFIALALSAALVEYSQHSGLMRNTALTDVAQLCADLRSERACPKELHFPTRPAKDPWSHPYRCRATLRGLILYTLGEDNQQGGRRRDTDIACRSLFAAADSEPDACSCFIGEDATALLHNPEIHLR
jgi:hypothetical protein